MLKNAEEIELISQPPTLGEEEDSQKQVNNVMERKKCKALEEERQDFIDFSSDDHANKKSELDMCLEEGKLDVEYHMDMDALQYLKEHHGRFSCLSKMAIDVLSISITTVASESSFSISSRVLTKYRCSLLSRNVQAIICTRNWLNGFACEDDEDNVTDLSMDYKASNVVNVDE
nr:zinc finger BED domain-containing protein DAYSLEEPER-like [Ipomoea batatas]